MSDPVYILLRTSGRPNFFDICYKSIKEQDYDNIVIITHVDDKRDTYAKGDKIISTYNFDNRCRGYYNLYCNKLLKAIPDGPGWYHFIDDDDKYTDKNVISRLVENSKREYLNVGRSRRAEGIVWPKSWKKQRSFQTECFFLHTDHKNKATWWNQKGGDHHYTMQLTTEHNMPINWIDNLIICEAMAGKGHGRRLDYRMQEKASRKHSIVSFIGDKRENRDMRYVRYLVDVPGRYYSTGKKNEKKYIHKDYAKVLQKEGKIEILEANGG